VHEAKGGVLRAGGVFNGAPRRAPAAARRAPQLAHHVHRPRSAQQSTTTTLLEKFWTTTSLLILTEMRPIMNVSQLQVRES